MAREKAFKPIAIELGWLVYEWNRLHAALGLVFWKVSRTEQMSTALAIWHSTTQDLPQRKMLSAALQGAFSHEVVPSMEAQEDVEWLLKQATSLAEKRNDAIHSPLSFGINMERAALEVFADWTLGHGRANRLKEKDLLKELTWYRRSSREFADYAEAIYWALETPQRRPWPQRPVLPTLGQRSDRPVRPLRPRKESRARPRRAS